MDGFDSYVKYLSKCRVKLVQGAKMARMELIADTMLENEWISNERYQLCMSKVTAADRARLLIDEARRQGEMCSAEVARLWWQSEPCLTATPSSPSSSSAAFSPQQSSSAAFSPQQSISMAIVSALEDLTAEELSCLKFYMRSTDGFKVSKMEKADSRCKLASLIKSTFPGVKAIAKTAQYMRKMNKNKTANDLIEAFQLDETAILEEIYAESTPCAGTSSTSGPRPSPAASATYSGRKSGSPSPGSNLSEKGARGNAYINAAIDAFEDLSKSEAHRFCWFLGLPDQAQDSPGDLPLSIMKSVNWNMLFAHNIMTNTLDKIPRADLTQRLQAAYDGK